MPRFFMYFNVIMLTIVLTAFAISAFAQDDSAYGRLSPQERGALIEQLSAVNPQTVIILCNDEDCSQLASSLKGAFKADGWDATKDNFQFGKLKPGIHVWSKNKKITTILNQTTGINAQPLKDDILNEKAAAVVITIGEKQ